MSFADPVRFTVVPEGTSRTLDQRRRTKVLHTETTVVRQVDNPIKLATVLSNLVIHPEGCGPEVRLLGQQIRPIRVFSCRKTIYEK